MTNIMASIEEIVSRLDPIHQAVYDFLIHRQTGEEKASIPEGPSVALAAESQPGPDSFALIDGTDRTLIAKAEYKGPAREAIFYSPSDRWVNHYEVDLKGLGHYEIYPLGDGRSWVYSTEQSPEGDKTYDKGELLSPAQAALFVKQLFRWVDLVNTNRSKVIQDPQAIQIDGTTIPVISERPLPPETLNAIGIGLSRPLVAKAALDSTKTPFLVLVAPDIDSMKKLCDKADRCFYEPEREGASLLSEVVADYDETGHLMKIYTSGGQNLSRKDVANNVYHESGHLIGDHFFKEKDAPLPSDGFDGLNPLIEGFLTATGAPSGLVSRMILPRRVRSIDDEINLDRNYWPEEFSVGSSSPLKWGILLDRFPQPSEWYARLGVCTFWDESCREELGRFFPPMIGAFEVHERGNEAGGRRTLLAETYRRLMTNHGDSCPSQKTTEPPIETRQSHWLGPYRIDSCLDQDQRGKIFTSGCRVMIGGETVPWDDPDFQLYLAQYNLSVGGRSPFRIDPAEVYLRFLENHGGSNWREERIFSSFDNPASPLMQAVGYDTHDRFQFHTYSFQKITIIARHWRQDSPKEKGDSMGWMVSNLQSYYFMNDALDLPAGVEVDSLIAILKQNLGEEDYRFLIEQFFNAALGDLETYKYDSQKITFIHWFVGRLFAGAGLANPSSGSELVCSRP